MGIAAYIFISALVFAGQMISRAEHPHVGLIGFLAPMVMVVWAVVIMIGGQE